MLKTIVLAIALAFSAGLHAQPASAPASTPAKKELIAKILQVQTPAVENLARQLVEQPALQLLQRAGMFIQARVPAEKREDAAKDVQAQAKKYVDETYPMVREKALKLTPTTVGVVLDKELSEDELRQVLAVFESPAWRKFEALSAQMQKALGEQLVADAKVQVEPRVRALDQAMSKRLGIVAPAASGASAASGLK